MLDVEKKNDITKVISMTQFEFQLELDKVRLEQKAIDEAESGKELLYVVNKTTERVRKEVIEKACKSFCNRCVHNQTLKKCMYMKKDCPLIGAFRKEMEE